MKYKTTLLAASTLFAFSGLSMAGDKDGTCKEGEKCETTCADKDMAGTTKFVVTGMTCGGCSGKLKTSLAALEGVTVKSVCHKSGNVVVKIDEKKSDKSKVEAAIVKAGFKVEKKKEKAS